jgi:ATP-binding cassette subfamily B protein
LNPQLTTFQVYKRALALLAQERWAAIGVGAAAMINAAVMLAEPVLFGRVVDALSRGQEAFPIIGLWAAIGLFGIFAGTAVSVAADRLAHRRRLAAMAQAFERAIILPISYHAEKGSGAVVRTILAGSDTLFWTWLSFLREQLTALVGIVMMVPLVIRMNGTMALILGGSPCSMWRLTCLSHARRAPTRPRWSSITSTSPAASATCWAMSRWCRAMPG